MNKLITKIAGACLGLAMAIGVGVAVGNDTKSVEPANAVSYTWQKVTSTSEFVDGVELLVTQDSYYLNVSATSTSQTPRMASLTLSNNLPTLTANNTECFVVSGTGSSIKLCKATDTTKWLITGTSNNAARINTGTTGNYWTIENGPSSGEFYLKSNASTARYLSRYQTTDFRSYTNTNTNANLVLYKLVEAKTLSSIALSGTYPTTFTVGDSFDHTGMTVTATYSDSTTANVTSSATFSGYNMSSAGNQTVTVSYTEGGTTKTATYSITVSAPTSPTLSFDKTSFSGYTGQSISITATYANLESDLAWSASGTGSISGGSITWSSSDHRNGTSTYTCTLSGEGGKTIVADADGVDAAQCVITITQTTVDITKSSTSIAQGKSETLAVSHNASSVDGLTWTSNNAKVTVDSDGKVTVANDATVDSTATITATSKVDTSVSDTCTVTVTAAPLEYEVVFGTAEGTSGITDFSNSSYIIPSGVTLDNIQGNVYSNTSNQAASLRFGKSGTTGSFDATISGNYYIVSVTCNLKYYGSDTTATFAVTPDGGSAISKSLTGSWADYTYDVSASQIKKVTLGTDVNGKRAYLSGFTITYAALKTLSSITLTGTYPTSFTKGDTFSHSGMIVTANYSDSTSAVVTGSATWSSPDMSTTGSKTITVSYSDAYGSASTTYSISVNYAAPTSITLSHNSGAVALEETFDVSEIGVTINPSTTADQTAYTWSLYDDGGLVEDTDYVWISPEIMSYTAGTFVFRCTSTEDGTKYAEFTLTVSGDPLAHLKDESDEDVTSGSKTVYADAGIISFSVTAENFQGTLTYTWSSSNTSIIDIDADADDMCDYEVKAAGSARLSCRIQGSVKGDVAVYVDVTVTAVTVTSVTWTAPTIDVFSGSTLTASDASSWNVIYSTNSGKTDQTPDSFDVKLGGSTISLPHTWAAADDGKTLCVEVGGVSSSTTTVTVTQSINNVMASSTSSWEYTFTAKAWSAAGDHALDDKTWTMSGTDDGTPYFGYDATKGQQFGSGTHPFSDVSLQSSDFSGTIDSVTVYTSGANSINATVQVSVGGTAYGSAQTITNTNTAYTFDLGGKSGTISIDYVNSSSKAIYVKEIVVNTVSGSQNIANVAAHKAAQRVAVKFANAFNAAMDDTEYCTTGLSAAWSACSSAYNTFKSEAAALGETEEAYAKNLIKYATAQYSNDNGEACIERMMKTYEVCVNKHGQTEFMSDLITLGRASTPSPLTTIKGVSNTTVVIVVMTSLVGVAAIGGYFFLRKRKEK